MAILRLIPSVVKRRTEASTGGSKECLHSRVTILVRGHERRCAVSPATTRTTVGGGCGGLISSRSLHHSSIGWRRVGRCLTGHALLFDDMEQETTLDLVETMGHGMALLLVTVQLVLRHEGWDDVHGNHSKGNVDVGRIGLGTADVTGCHGRIASSARCDCLLLFTCRLGWLLLFLGLVLVVRSNANSGLPMSTHAYCPRGAAEFPGIIVDTAVIAAELTQKHGYVAMCCRIMRWKARPRMMLQISKEFFAGK